MNNASNPLLDTIALPRFAEVVADQIAPALDVALANHEATIETLTTTRPTDFSSVWLPYERANTQISAVWSTVSHLYGVADTPALRTAYLDGQKRLVENDMKVGQNPALHDILVALRDSAEFRVLSDEDRVAVEREIRSFTLSGVALEPEARDLFKAISVELSSLSSDFGSAVLDATDAWSELITDESMLDGISNSDKAMFAGAASAVGQRGWLVTLQYPSINAVLSFAENRQLRFRVYEASTTRASDQGPQAGQFDNSARITRILELRHQAAKLLGFADPVAWSLATKMASNADEILTFLRDLGHRAKPSAERELAELQNFAADECGIDDFQPWDSAFVSNRLRQARYAVDEQAVRAYFPVERVMAGWQDLMKRLFGVSLVKRDGASLYHEDVRFFDVIDDGGTVIAGLYVDLHARTGKRGGAWMDQARSKLQDGNIVAVPVAYLVCNFAPKGGDNPSLLSHSDVTTLLHETGHCIHLLFTQVNRPSIAGTNGFEWDAVELPSQIMEDFAWDRDVLTAMSGHYLTGAPLPAEMFDRMLKARHFLAAMFILRQVELALFDLILHLGTMGSDPMTVLKAVRDEVAVIQPPEWNRLPHAFSHIFSGGYAAGYYSYLWAELLAADGFMAFSETGVVNMETGRRFREEVLSRGATRPARDSFRAFRGRDPEPDAMLLRHGLQ